MTSAHPDQDARSTPDATGRKARTRRPAPDHRPGTLARVLVLARVALVPAITCYAVGVVLAAVLVALASGTTPGGAPGLDQAVAVGVPLWLAAHLVPLTLSGVPFGALPLAPAFGVGALVAVVARGAVRRLAVVDGRAAGSPATNHAAAVVATASAAHAVIGVLAAALLTPETVVDASPGQAGVVCGLLGGVAALVGVAGPAGLLAELRRRLPGWAHRGLVAGALAASAMVTAGALLTLAALLADAASVADVLTRVAPEAGSGAGLALLSALYLPNAVIGATSWALGPGVSIGLASAAPTAATAPAALPPIPLLAALPSGPPPTWAGLVFAVPLAIGTAVGWRLAPGTPAPAARRRALAAVATAAATAAVTLGAGAALAGGRLGAGPFDPVSVPVLLLAGVTAAWVLVPAATVALLAVPAPRPVARRAPTGRPASAGPGNGPGEPGDGEPGGGEPGDAAPVTTGGGAGGGPGAGPAD